MTIESISIRELPASLRPDRYFDTVAHLPVAKVGNSNLVVKDIGAEDDDFGLLRFVDNGAIDQFVDCAGKHDGH